MCLEHLNDDLSSTHTPENTFLNVSVPPYSMQRREVTLPWAPSWYPSLPPPSVLPPQQSLPAQIPYQELTCSQNAQIDPPRHQMPPGSLETETHPSFQNLATSGHIPKQQENLW